MIAVVFPGQGSQKPGMGQSLVEHFPEAQTVFSQVSEAVGKDLRHLCFDSSEEELRATENAQIALFTVGLAAWFSLKSQVEVEPAFFAGHSIGEYAAVVAAGALTLDDGAQLVMRRGQLMATAPDGAMAAVLGLERVALEAELSRLPGTVVVANDNCPGQLVISGDREAVLQSVEPLTSAGAKRVLPLNVSGAFHSPLMESAAEQMGAALREVPWKTAHPPVVTNVHAKASDPQTSWPDVLRAQLSSPVRWTESVQAMIAEGVETFVECGSGEVLTGLLKRIDKSCRGISCSDHESVRAVMDVLGGEAK